jgi:ABC-type glycerol-3-phosphate transport system substrate-binding protein
MRKKVLILALSLFVLTGITGCSKNETLQGASDNEIITTTAVDQKKTMITVRVEFGAGQQENLEKVLEEKFPEVDFVLRHDGSTSSVYTMRANLEAGVECDLILSRKLPTTEDIAEQYLLDLSSETFVDSYYMNAVDSCADANGRIYYLPGPSDVYGIVYDKTMFMENGWSVPHSYSEFVALLETIRQDSAQSGETVVPIQISLMYPDMFQILFNTYGYEDAYAGSDNFIWLTQYQQGIGSMTGHMEKAVSRFKKLFEDGILSLAALEVTPSERSQMMYVEHSTAMIIECQNAVNYQRVLSTADENDAHEIAMMPFWTSDDQDGDYLYVIPSYYMAVNKKAAEESTQKKELLLDIFRYLSSVEGQRMLIGDDFQISNIAGVPLNVNTFSEEIINTIERGQMINTFYLAAGETDKQVERQMLSSVKDMILGNISVEDWLLSADSVRDQYIAGQLQTEQSYGTAETTLTRLETAYTMAQMYSDLMNTQIGICRGGGYRRSTNGYIYEGDITDSSLACITPEKVDMSGETNPDADKIVTSYLTGRQIVDILNNGVEKEDTKGLNVYYVASGLDVVFAPWAEDGSRVVSCKLADGSDIDMDAVYEVAYFNGSLPDIEVKMERMLDMSWSEAFETWLKEQGGVIKKPQMTLKLKYDK